jgi:hypothetical protein
MDQAASISVSILDIGEKRPVEIAVASYQDIAFINEGLSWWQSAKIHGVFEAAPERCSGFCTSLNVLKCDLPHLLIFLPCAFEHLDIELDILHGVVLDRQVLEVSPDLCAGGVILRPVWIRLERCLVGVRRTSLSNHTLVLRVVNLHVASHSWIRIFKPSASNIRILLVANEVYVLELSRDSNATHQACETSTDRDDPQWSSFIKSVVHESRGLLA